MLDAGPHTRKQRTMLRVGKKIHEEENPTSVTALLDRQKDMDIQKDTRLRLTEHVGNTLISSTRKAEASRWITKFKNSLVYIANCKAARATQCEPLQIIK